METSDEKELKIGDIIYREVSYNGILQRIKVVKVLKRKVVCDSGDELKKEYLHQFNRSRWDHDFYRLATPELDQAYKKQNIVRKLRKTEFNKFSFLYNYIE